MSEKFSPEHSDIMAVAHKYHGNLQAMANHYGVARSTMYEYFYRNHNGIEIMREVRKYNKETYCDLAEYVINYNMTNYKSNANLAQRASEFYLDRNGQDRGYKKLAEDQQVNEQQVQQMKELLAQIERLQDRNQSDLNSCDNNNNPAT